MVKQLGGAMTSQVTIIFETQENHEAQSNLLNSLVKDFIDSLVDPYLDEKSIRISVYHEIIEEE